MKYLLDTNVVSELSRRAPAPEVISFLEQKDQNDLVISVITLAEIRIGALKSTDELQRRRFLAWAEAVESQFQSRILPFDVDAARIFADIRVHTLQIGRKTEVQDLIIAATGIQRGLTVVTRNVRHFEPTGVPVLNPWDTAAT